MITGDLIVHVSAPIPAPLHGSPVDCDSLAQALTAAFPEIIIRTVRPVGITPRVTAVLRVKAFTWTSEHQTRAARVIAAGLAAQSERQYPGQVLFPLNTAPWDLPARQNDPWGPGR